MRYAFVVVLVAPFMPAPFAALAAPLIAGAKALGNMALGGVARQAAQTGLGAAAKQGAKVAAQGGNRAKLMNFAQQAGQQHARKKQMEDQKRERHLESTRQAAERSRGSTTTGFGQ